MTDLSNGTLFIYGLIILTALLIGIIQWVRRRYEVLAVLAIILSLLLPLVSFLYSINRPEGMNEIAYIWQQARGRSGIGVFLLLGYLYILFWIFFGPELKKLYTFISDKIKRIIRWWKNREQRQNKNKMKEEI
ncbi:hypothetical protein MKY30_16405 [Oceanobacillus sp. FSL W8-0428]|uniref:Uncharacterized protein n=1 Tax=Oceanobacillus sojae TaxID=582851 RepID=A0A511ZE74_9BACI|nr:hypothetical protein [Oceanobacillus sojae]GEN85743.1 hypothetical protein OSO01_04820 [Oceanobacillus sojae]